MSSVIRQALIREEGLGDSGEPQSWSKVVWLATVEVEGGKHMHLNRQKVFTPSKNTGWQTLFSSPYVSPNMSAYKIVHNQEGFHTGCMLE